MGPEDTLPTDIRIYIGLGVLFLIIVFIIIWSSNRRDKHGGNN